VSIEYYGNDPSKKRNKWLLEDGINYYQRGQIIFKLNDGQIVTITDELGNLILTEEGDYIVSELNPCITPTPTPTITQTSNPTPTPTPSITETSTPTPTPTTTETPTQTPTNTETPTQTPTNTLTPTPSSTPPTNYWEITNCSSVFNIIVNFGAYVPNQGEIYNLTMVGYSPPNNWNCWQVVGTSAGPPFAPVQTINSGPWVDCPSCPL
jgi:hypothetical protein